MSKQATPHEERSWAALARALGVERNSVAAWRKPDPKRPPAPTSRNVPEWERYIEDNDLGVQGGSQELKDENLRLRNKKIGLEIEQQQGKLISIDEHDREIFHITSRVSTMLYQFLETEAPPKLDGLPAAQMRPILREMADSICRAMADIANDEIK